MKEGLSHHFIGRGDELRRLDELSTKFRAVTLFGLGGVGKSRLALEWARDLDHVVVDLSGLNGNEALARTREALGEGSRLVVVDHVPPHSDGIGELLSSSEADLILTTSRHRLHLEFAAALHVTPFDPSSGAAVELVQWHLHRLGIDDFQTTAVRQIAHRLGGIPLLLEKVAHYAFLVGVTKTAETLEADTTLFMQAMDIDEDAVVDLEELKDSGALETLVAAATFREAFDLDALTTVTRLSHTKLVAQLAALESRGLVNVRHVNDAVRYSVCNVVGDLVRERHRPSPEVLKRHALAVLNRPQDHSTEDLHAIFDRACDDEVNLVEGLQAMAKAAERPDVDLHRLRDAANQMNSVPGFDAHVAILLGVARRQLQAGELDEVETLLATATEAASSPRECALVKDASAGRFRVSGKTVAAAALYKAALEDLAADDHEDPQVEAKVRSNFAAVLWELGEREGAHRQMETALHLFRAVKDRRAEGVVLANRGVMFHHEGDFDAAHHAHHRALELHREVGHDRFEAITLFDLGTLAHERGALRSAHRLHVKAASALERVGDLRQAALARAAVDALDAALGQSRIRSRERVQLGDDVYTRAIGLYRKLEAAYVAMGFGGDALVEFELDLESAPDEVRLPGRLLKQLGHDTCLVVTPDFERLRAPSDETIVDIGRRDALRNILSALVANRHEDEGALNANRLIAAGWPDETIEEGAATNRLHVALSALRKLGLRDVLHTVDEGWQLDDRVVVLISGDPATH